MDPLRACVLSVAALCLVGIVTSRQFCIVTPVKNSLPGDLRKSTEALRWCGRLVHREKPPSPEAAVQYVLDLYKPNVTDWLSKLRLKRLRLPIRKGEGVHGKYSFTGYRIRHAMSVKNLAVHQVNTRNVSILLSVYFRRLVVLMDIQAEVCILFSTSGPYQCAQVRNTQKIKVKNAAASLIATWQIAETGEALSLEPSDTRLDVNHNGTEVKPGKLEVIPAKYQIYFEDRARKLLDTPAKKTWPLFKEGIMGWLKHGLKNQFDEAIRPSLTHAFNTIILNA